MNIPNNIINELEHGVTGPVDITPFQNVNLQNSMDALDNLTVEMFDASNNQVDISNNLAIIENDMNNNLNLLQSKMNTYKIMVNNYNSLNKLNKEYSEKTVVIEKNNLRVDKSIATNDRKSYYESQQYEHLILWFMRFRWFYYVFAIMLISILFLSKNELQFNVKIIVSIGLLIYPFVINYVLLPFVYLFRFIYDLIPKNVYNTL